MITKKKITIRMRIVLERLKITGGEIKKYL
jgi:hypothetical protein